MKSLDNSDRDKKKTRLAGSAGPGTDGSGSAQARPSIKARDLMSTTFMRIGGGHSLRETIGILFEPAGPIQTQAPPDVARTLVVVEPDGTFSGLLTPRYLMLALFRGWQPDEAVLKDDQRLSDILLTRGSERLKMSVAEAMNREAPVIHPDDGMLKMLKLAGEKRLECLPVVNPENGNAIGIVSMNTLFRALADISLTAETEGIRLDDG